MTKIRNRRLSAVLAGVIGVLLVAGVASAAWTSTGSGLGAAKAATAQALSVSAGTASADLYPGGPNGSLVVTVTNPNPYPVQVSTVTPGAVSGITSTAGSSCSGSTTGISFTWTSKALTQVIAGSGGTFTYTFTGALAMSNASDASCSGATFAVPVVFAASSAAGTAPTSPTSASIALP